MAYTLIYDSRRWVRSDSTDVTIVLPQAAGGTGDATGSPTFTNITVGAGGAGAQTSTLTLNSGSGAGGFGVIYLKRNSIEKGAVAVASGNGEFTPLSVANDLIIRAAQKINFSADGGTTDHLSLGPTGVLSLLNAPLRLKAYTVATLPAGAQGYIAFCTDLAAPTFGAVAVGGGAVVGIVFYTGVAWVTL